MSAATLKKIALFPGSFDPITKGHENIILRGAEVFDEIIVAIGTNAQKQTMFSLEKRLELLKSTFLNNHKITVTHYEGLTVNFCKQINADFILRGIRSVTDMEYERSIADMNALLAPEIETVFMFSGHGLSAINSTLIRDIYRNQGDIKPFLPEAISKDF
jgi:pantetheine-phosphate adenylyltransferase